MTTCTIGDIHGKSTWKNIINPNEYEKIIFIGDYVDSYDIPTQKILENLADIIAFKRAYKDKVVLLLGNHDLQYFYNTNMDYRCSGFKFEMQFLYNDLFKQNESFFQVAYQYKNYLWTHAGVSKKWLYKYQADLKSSFDLKDDLSNLAYVLNIVNKSSWQPILHEVGRLRGGSPGNCGGITWADRNETLEGLPAGLHQVVGHTPLDKPTTYTKLMGTEFTDRSITYIDCLSKGGVYKLSI